MIQVSTSLKSALNAGTNRPVDLYELYLDSGTLYYSDQRIVWGGHIYQPQVQSRSTIKRYDGGQFDQVTVTFSNVDLQLAQIMLTNEIEGRRLVIRKIDRTVADDSIVLFNGQMARAIAIDENAVQVSATQIVGSVDQDCPSRNFCLMCPWEFKGAGGECGYTGPGDTCDKSWAQCASYNNTNSYGGFRFLPMSESVMVWYSDGSRKRMFATTADDLPVDNCIPIVLGRRLVDGKVIQHLYEGNLTHVLAAISAGLCGDFVYALVNNALCEPDFGYELPNGSTVNSLRPHIGFGGDLTDPMFPNTYPYRLLGYVGLTHYTTDASVPAIKCLAFGLRTLNMTVQPGDWTDNPVWNVRGFMTLPSAQGGMGIPDDWFDDAACQETSDYCDEQIPDWTGCQRIYLPQSLPDGVIVGQNYRCFQSTCVAGADPRVDGPYNTYEQSLLDETAAPPEVAVRRFTLNAVISEQSAAIDILFKKLLPSFRGYITYSKDGKIQIRCERPVKNAGVSATVAPGVTNIPCDAPSNFAAGDSVLLSPFTAQAEVASVTAALGNSIQLAAPTQFTHVQGQAIYRIDMAFDDSNIVGSFAYPLGDRQSSINRVTVKFPNAPLGYAVQELDINDYAHQSAVHKLNNEDAQWADCIDSYFQAWRVGQWHLAKYRDLGKFCQFRADIKATRMEIGDVFAVSAVEAGLQCVPFRVVEIGFNEDDEVDLVGQLYDIGIYSDSAPQTSVTVPAIFVPQRAISPPPAPTFTATAGTGVLILGPITFPTGGAPRYASNAVFDIYYWDEFDSFVWTLGDSESDGDSVTFPSLDGWPTPVPLAVGSYWLFDTEILRLTAIEGGNFTFARRQFGSTKGLPNGPYIDLHRLAVESKGFPFSEGFFTSDASLGWNAAVPWGARSIAAITLVLSNDAGSSPVGLFMPLCRTEYGYVQMLRVYAGGQVDLIVDGVLGIESNAVGAITIGHAKSIRAIKATCDVPPQGGGILFDLHIGNVGWVLGIADPPDGRLDTPGLFWGSAIPADSVLTLGISEVGTVFPGKRLIVSIYY